MNNPLRRLSTIGVLGLVTLGLGCATTRPPEPAAKDQTGEVIEPAKEAEATTVSLALVDGVWAPFTDVEGKPRIALSLVHEALGRAGVKVTTSIVAPGGVIPAIETGTFDGSEALWKSPEREAFLLFSKPYLENRLVLIGRRGTDVSATAVAELKGKKLGVVAEYAYGPEILEAPGVTLVRGTSDEENLRTLLRGEVDYLVVDELLVQQLLTAEPAKTTKLLAIGTQPMAVRGLHLALRKDFPHAAEILARFDAEVLTLRKDGTYHRLLKLLWVMTDADGDGVEELVLGGTHAGLSEPTTRYQLFGAPAKGAPRILIEGEIYQDWAAVPDRFKLPPDPLTTPPSMQAVLFEF